ncbi:C6 transcription factor (War1) [Hirsutella rhossiliensis]|uniref:C6 transcription factor (War1) n=1 Tax=Hirsutella rhossiliensis TaxID=111463 RepID=A0A9P8SLB6_9HYPO|nr:C6 transcription factor (War1) [Hirsutella rhossiliensis]KAH0967308.1 C6 transcription factor (War1) [Hirsutella rhossiliensis]
MELDPRLRPGQASPPPDAGKKQSSTPSSESESASPSSPQLESSSAAAAAHAQQQDAAAEEAIRKPRACEACRSLKVRCVTTAPTRKRQRKTDSRVLELEKKIDALTASLQARAAPAAAGGSSASPRVAAASAASQAHRPSGGGTVWGAHDEATSWGAATVETGQGRRQQQQQHRLSAALYEPAAATAAAGQKRKAAESPDGNDNDNGSNEHGRSPSPAPALVPKPSERDIVDRGLVSVEKAAELFSRYKESMIRHMPAVVFPPSMSSMELRRSKPYLFLAIMAAASSETHRLQRALHRELMQLFAYKIVVAGEKNLELVQALHVAVVWYWPPEHFEELKFYQLVHMAAVMALDIGLGKPRAPSRRGIPPFSWREAARPPERRHDAQPDPTSLECRRAWLACHFFAANTAMSLHRPNLIRWSSFMTESLDLLASSPDAAPTDQYLCHLVWTHRKGEEIGVQFSMDDPGAAPVNITDARTQYALRALERDLAKYRASVAKELLQPTLKIGFHLLSLYMHELVLHSNMSTEQIRPPFNTDAIRDGMVGRAEPLSAAHINALSACLGAIAGILDTFLAMDVSAIRCLPVFNFVRVAYAVVVLMKMFFSASDPRFELGSIIGRGDLRVDFYLDALLQKFRVTAADDRCRPAAKFLVVLVMLKSWFLRQAKADVDSGGGGGGGGAVEGGDGSGAALSGTSPAPPDAPPPSSAQHPRQHSLNTPLQVLSEVAMGRESSGPPRPVFGSLPDIRPGHAHHLHKPLFHDAASSAGGASTSSPSGPSANFTPTAAAAAAMGPASSSSSSIGAGPGAAGAFPHPPWMDQQQQQQQQQPPAPNWDPLTGLPPSLGLDLESLGLPLDSYDAHAGGARIIINEPWFTDVFQGLPDPNVFPF